MSTNMTLSTISRGRSHYPHQCLLDPSTHRVNKEVILPNLVARCGTVST